MHVSQTLRRLAFVALTSSLIGTVPFAAPSQAAATGAITNVSPNAQSNTGSAIVTLTTEHTFAPAASATITVSRTGASSDTLSVSNVSGSGNSVTATFNATNANPGTYDISITGTAVPVVGQTPPYTDTCTACFNVLAFKPEVDSLTPNTIGGNGWKLVDVAGSNFTTDASWDYCSGDSCAGRPTIQVSPADGITFSTTVSPSANAANVAATTTTRIQRRINVAAGATPGPRDIVVTNTDGKTDTCTGCLVVGPTPTVTAVTPGVLARNVSRAVVFTGTNYASGVTAAVRLPNGNADANITLGSISRTSSSELSIPFTVADGAATGSRTITLTNPDGGNVSTTLFSVNARPTVTEVAHSDATPTTEYGQGALNRTLTITGTLFQNGATVSIADPAGVTINSTIVESPTTITVNVTLAQAGSAPPTVGAHDVTVTNPDGGVSTAEGGMLDETTEVLNVVAGPTISSVSPPSRGRGENVTLTLTGTNFDSGVTVAIDDVTNIVVTNVDTDDDVVTLTGTVSNALNVAGVKNITLTNNGDRGRYVCTGCFSVDNLQTNTISPEFVLNDSAQSFTVTGSGFASNAVVSLVKTGLNSGVVADIVGTNTQVNVSGTSVTTTLPLTGVASGPWLVRVTNPTSNPGVGTCACKLTVVAPAPNITTVSPANRGDGAQNETITITGTHFLPGASVTFDNAGISVVGTPVVTPTSITAVVNIAPGSYSPVDNQNPVEPEQIHVTNTDSQTDAVDFTVNEGPATESIDRAARAQGSANTVTITGTNFADGSQVLLSGTGVTVGPLTFTDSQVPSADTLAATFTVAGDAPVGPRTVTVLNPDGGRSTCTCTFSVNAPPTVTGLLPDKGARSASPTVTITGTNFAASPAITVSGGGVTVSNVTLVDPATITATFAPAADAALTTRDVTVTNADGGAATLLGSFKVFTVPNAPTDVTATPGDGSATVSWTAPGSDGNDPLIGYEVVSDPVTTTQQVAAGTTQVTFPGLVNGTAYKFSVLAKNAAGNGAASPQSAAVTPRTLPGVPTNVVVSPGEGAVTVGWTAPASNGGSPLTGYVVTVSPGGTQKNAGADATSLVFDGLTNGTAYRFTVGATNAAGTATSAESAEVVPFTFPGAPTSVTGTAADGAANLSWTAPADNGGSAVNGYLVTASPGGATKAVDGTTTSVNFGGLTNGTAYTFTVRASNERGAGPVSAASAPITPTTVPGAPTNVQGTPGDGKVTLTWSAPTSGGFPVDEYVVTASPGAIEKTVNGTTLTLAFDGLTNGTAYTFTVGARNGAGTTTSLPSGQITPRTVPGAPTGVSAARGDQRATITWTAPASNGGSAITGYVITVSPGGSTVNAPAGSTSRLITGLTNGTSYTFAVKATNAAGTGAAGTSNAVTPMASTALGLTAPSQVVAGNGVTIRGILTRGSGAGVAGRQIRILAKTAPATTFSTVRLVTTAADGSFATTFTLSRGTVTWKAVFPGATGFLGSTSVERVTKVAYRVTASYSLSGRTLTVTGGVAPNAAGRVIHLQYRRADGSVVTLSSVRVASNNTYRFAKTMAPGTYSVFVFLPAGTTNVAGRSVARSITVR